MSTPIPSRIPVGSPETIDASLRALCGKLKIEAPGLLPQVQALLPEGAADEDAGFPTNSDAESDLPAPDYDRHPYYGAFREADEATRASVTGRYLESFCNLVRAEQALARRVRASSEIDRPTGTQRSPALAALEDTGVWRFRLSASELNETLERSEPAAQALEARRLALGPQQRGVEGVLQLLAEHTDPGADFEFYSGLLRNHGVYELLEQYYGCSFRLLMVNLQINSGDDTGISRVCSYPDGRRAPTYYMHVDSAVGVVKILMYRTGPVTADNGAFRYVPGSHKALDPVQRAMRKACDKAGFDGLKDETRASFMALPPALRRKANFGNDLLPELGLDTAPLLANEAVLEGDGGDGILADINGVHRGNLHADPAGRREMFKFVLKAQKS